MFILELCVCSGYCTISRVLILFALFPFVYVKGDELSEPDTTPSPDVMNETVSTEKQPKAMSGDYYNTFHNLHLQILQSYNPHVRPEIGSGWPMKCNFSMVVTHLTNVDENAQTVDLHGWVILSWNDHRLAWNDSSEYIEIDKILMQQKFVWRPDLHLYNNAHTQVDTLVSTSSLVQIFNDGRILMDPAVILRPYCQFDYTTYPWETHKCAVYIGSWAYRSHEFQWHLHPVTTESLPVIYSNSHRATASWRITDAITKLADVEFDGEFWHYVNITFHFKRTATFAANLILIPASLTAVLTSFALLLASGTDWKLTVILTSLVLEIGHYIALHIILPHGVINGKPRIISLCKANIVTTLIIFLLGLTVNMVCNRRDNPPYWLRRLTEHKLFNVVCCAWSNGTDTVPRYSLKASQNRRPPGQRDQLLITNQLTIPKRPVSALSADEQDRSASTSARTEIDTPIRTLIDRRLVAGYETRRDGPWWKLSIVLDRILFVVLAVVYAVLWIVYVAV